MGEYENYLKNRERGIRSDPEEGIEVRTSAALDAIEALAGARARLEEFAASYTDSIAGDLQMAATYRETGTKESIVARIERSTQEIITMRIKPDGSQPVLLLDDLKILLAATDRQSCVQPDE